MDDIKIGEILLPRRGIRAGAQGTQGAPPVLADLRCAARQIPFSRDLVAAYIAQWIRRRRRARAAFCSRRSAYFVLPLDFVPDMLAMIGFSDDIAVLTAPSPRSAARSRNGITQKADEVAARQRRAVSVRCCGLCGVCFIPPAPEAPLPQSRPESQTLARFFVT